ncbi:MAG TPA: hypothetical protein VF491_17680 [Vicinamibacterales bacterium]
MTLPQFADIFAVLAVQLRATDADEATIRAYYNTLKDIEPEYVAMAANEMARTHEWFPKTSEWRQAASKVKNDRRRQQQELLRNLASPLCAACSDTGWALDASQRAYRCDCQTLRQLELLGRRPWPKLIAAKPEPTTLEQDQIMARIRASVRSFPRLVEPVTHEPDDMEESA